MAQVKKEGVTMETIGTIEIIGKDQLKEFLLNCFQGEEYRENLVIDGIKIDLYFTKRSLAIFIDQECLKKEAIANIRKLLKCHSYVIEDVSTYTDLSQIINDVRLFLVLQEKVK